jgi:hypothetical protein
MVTIYGNRLDELRQWVEPDVRQERFDIREVNARLATIGW